MTSTMAEGLRSRMGEYSDQGFEDMLGIGKTAFLKYLEKKAEIEARCIVEVGERAPDFKAHLLEEAGGVSPELFGLADLDGKPSSQIFGCYTCPIFRRQTDRMQELIATHKAKVQFLFVYAKEAHPTDGWNTPSNKADDIMYLQPTALEERARVAADWRRAYGITSPVLLDWADNRINVDYSGSPQRLYVLDATGVVNFKSEQGPYEDSHLEEWGAALAEVADDQAIRREL